MVRVRHAWWAVPEVMCPAPCVAPTPRRLEVDQERPVGDRYCNL